MIKYPAIISLIIVNKTMIFSCTAIHFKKQFYIKTVLILICTNNLYSPYIINGK